MNIYVIVESTVKIHSRCFRLIILRRSAEEAKNLVAVLSLDNSNSVTLFNIRLGELNA
jgi:hypothetical protein